jgi:hypothetical protein
MTIPFDLELAKMAVMVDTGYVATVQGDIVEIMTWRGSDGYIHGKVHSGPPGNMIFHCVWNIMGEITARSLGSEFDLVIKPTISL